jgi:hypothetical protein
VEENLEEQERVKVRDGGSFGVNRVTVLIRAGVGG